MVGIYEGGRRVGWKFEDEDFARVIESIEQAKKNYESIAKALDNFEAFNAEVRKEEARVNDDIDQIEASLEEKGYYFDLKKSDNISDAIRRKFNLSDAHYNWKKNDECVNGRLCCFLSINDFIHEQRPSYHGLLFDIVSGKTNIAKKFKIRSDECEWLLRPYVVKEYKNGTFDVVIPENVQKALLECAEASRPFLRNRYKWLIEKENLKV